MNRGLRGNSYQAKRRTAFTLAEVVIALAILAILIQGIVFGYISSARRAEWSAHSLAAQSLACQGVEQITKSALAAGAAYIDEAPLTTTFQLNGKANQVVELYREVKKP